MPEKSIHPAAANDDRNASAGGSRQSSLNTFVLVRWRGEVPLRVAFWRDMWCVGTAINIAAAALGMLLLAADVPTALAAFVFFSPLPYNLLLLVSVWRSAEKAGGTQAVAAQAAAALWVVLATVL